MEENGRRQFLKRATLAAIAAGSLGAVSAGRAAEGEKPAAKPILYRETEAWRKYYASLE